MVDSADVTAGQDGTATQYNNLRKDLHLAKVIRGTDTDAATITIDWSDMTKGKVRDITLGGNRIIAFSNVTVDQFIILNFIQPGSGGPWTASFSGSGISAIKWDSGTAPVLSQAANAIDTIIFHCTSSGNYRGYIGGMGLA